MKNEYTIKTATTLVEFLENELKMNHKKAKTFMSKGLVSLNGKTITKYNQELLPKQILKLNTYNQNLMDDSINILYEDKDIIVVEKPAGLLTIATNSEKEKTLYHEVSSYVKKRQKNARIFIVHRLDRETSGIILFAKSENVKKLYQENWEDLMKYRGYLAVVEGKLEEKMKTVKLKLKENASYRVYVANDGKLAITKYKVLKEGRKNSLVDIEILTGRKNQIRATMEFLEHPIIGDYKYGYKTKGAKRLALHAYKLNLMNPLTKKEMRFELDVPETFQRML